MGDEKWLRYQATLLSKKQSLIFDKAYKQVVNDPQLGKSDEFLQCPTCGAYAKGKNFSSHLKKHIPTKKINWGNIPLIKEQIDKKRQLAKLAGKPKAKIVSGGLPSLGKRK